MQINFRPIILSIFTLLIITSAKAVERIGECSFSIDGILLLSSSKCPIGEDKDGSITLFGTNVKAVPKYFVYLTVNNDGTATAYFNSRGGDKAHTSVGALYREHGCWVNKVAKICTDEAAKKERLVKRLNRPKKRQTKIDWSVSTIKTADDGSNYCEIKSSEGLGIRIFKNIDPLIAFLDLITYDVPELLWVGKDGPFYGQAQAGDYKYSTQMRIYAKRVSSTGQLEHIVGFVDSGSHLLDYMKRAKFLLVKLTRHGELTKSSADIVYSLTGSNRAIIKAEACLFNNHTLKNKLQFGRGKGETVIINSITNVNTKNAKSLINYTRDSAAATCRIIGENVLDECINRLVKNSLFKSELTANCETGKFTDFFGTKYIFEGKNQNKDFYYDFTIIDTDTNKALDGSSTSGYPYTLGVFKLLCPARIVE